jgi:hypothetical protein
MDRMASWTAEIRLVLVLNAVPALLVFAAWIWLSTVGPEGYWTVTGMLSLAWFLSGGALATAIWLLWTKKLALGVCVALNGVIFFLPIGLVAGIRYASGP